MLCQWMAEKVVEEIYAIPHHQGMKRFGDLVNSECLVCGEWLCVTAGEYTGVVECAKCGAKNLFRDSLKPLEGIPYEGRQGKIRRPSEPAA